MKHYTVKVTRLFESGSTLEIKHGCTGFSFDEKELVFHYEDMSMCAITQDNDNNIVEITIDEEK